MLNEIILSVLMIILGSTIIYITYKIFARTKLGMKLGDESVGF